MKSFRYSGVLFIFIVTAGSLGHASACTPELFIWNDRFEAPGYDEIYTEQHLVADGNEIWPDAPTSLLDDIPLLEAPPHWGNEFLELSVGNNDNGGALTRTELRQPIKSLHTHFEFIVLENSMEFDKWITIAVAKDAGMPGDFWPVAWSARLLQRDQLELLIRIANGTKTHHMPVSLRTLHTVDLWYAFNGNYYLFLDGKIFASGPILGGVPYTQEMWWLILGASGSSTGRNITVAIDNFLNTGQTCAH